MHQVTVTLAPSQHPSPRRLAPSTLAMSLAWEGFSHKKSRIAAIWIVAMATGCAEGRVEARTLSGWMYSHTPCRRLYCHPLPAPHRLTEHCSLRDRRGSCAHVPHAGPHHDLRMPLP